MTAALDTRGTRWHTLEHGPRFAREAGPIDKLRGLIDAVATGQANSQQRRKLRDLHEFVSFYVAANDRTLARRYSALETYVSTGKYSAAAEVTGFERRTIRRWVDEFLACAADELRHLSEYREAKRRRAELQAAEDTARAKLLDFLRAYCSSHGCGGDGRTIEIEPRLYRGTACPACATRAGLKGDAGWGG